MLDLVLKLLQMIIMLFLDYLLIILLKEFDNDVVLLDVLSWQHVEWLCRSTLFEWNQWSFRQTRPKGVQAIPRLLTERPREEEDIDSEWVRWFCSSSSRRGSGGDCWSILKEEYFSSSHRTFDLRDVVAYFPLSDVGQIAHLLINHRLHWWQRLKGLRENQWMSCGSLKLLVPPLNFFFAFRSICCVWAISLRMSWMTERSQLPTSLQSQTTQHLSRLF